MKKEDEQLKKIKRMKILDDFLLFFGKGKIGFKEPKDMKHFTMQFLKDGIVDLHETTEGKEKKYQRVGRIDLKKFAEAMKEIFERDLLSILKEIDIGNPQYQNTNVILTPTREEFGKKVQVKKREIKIDESKFSGLAYSVPMKELKNHDFRVAFWTEDNKQYALYRIDDKYYSLQVDDFMKLWEKILEKSVSRNLGTEKGTGAES
jgi:hypothetical protein